MLKGYKTGVDGDDGDAERMQTGVDGDGDAERMQTGVPMEMMVMLKECKTSVLMEMMVMLKGCNQAF
jgi:hypothetical protein